MNTDSSQNSTAKPPPVVSTYPDWASDSALFLPSQTFSFPSILGYPKSNLELSDNEALRIIRSQEVMSIFFASGCAALDGNQREQLHDYAHHFTAHPSTFVLQVSGFTDASGSKKSNLLLAKKRVDSVIDVLLDAGVLNDQIAMTIIGEGNESTYAQEARRVDIRLLLR